VSRRTPTRSLPAEGSTASTGSERRQIEIRTAQWSGPLPPPAIIAGYDRLVESGAERVFRQFELEAGHRRSQEEQSLRASVAESRMGQVVAALFAFSALGVTAYAIGHGANTVAGIIGGTTLVGVVGAFLFAKVKEGGTAPSAPGKVVE
jgi:uncharacterized membrane protein